MDARKKTQWDAYDRHLINKHFENVSWNELHVIVNETRHESDKVTIDSLRHEGRRMGLSKCIQIRWSEEDAKYLKRNYKMKGNLELSQKLNMRKKTYRVIDGKKVYRDFNSKSIEAKMKHLGLRRSDANLKGIVKRNRAIGLGDRITSTDNWYTRGVVKTYKDGDVRVWKRKGERYRVVKVNGKFTSLARWKYENEIHPIPEGYMLYFLDCDSLNDNVENLAIQKKGALPWAKRYGHAYSLLVMREENLMEELLELAKPIDGEEYIKSKHAELNRVRRIMSEVEAKLIKRKNRNGNIKK